MNLVSLQLHWTKKNYVRVLTKIHRMPPKKGMGKKKTFFPIMLIQESDKQVSAGALLEREEQRKEPVPQGPVSVRSPPHQPRRGPCCSFPTGTLQKLPGPLWGRQLFNDMDLTRTD